MPYHPYLTNIPCKFRSLAVILLDLCPSLSEIAASVGGLSSCLASTKALPPKTWVRCSSAHFYHAYDKRDCAGLVFASMLGVSFSAIEVNVADTRHSSTEVKWLLRIDHMLGSTSHTTTSLALIDDHDVFNR